MKHGQQAMQIKADNGFGTATALLRELMKPGASQHQMLHQLIVHARAVYADIELFSL